jgi:UDP-N-acetylmuramate--alanine ligase
MSALAKILLQKGVQVSGSDASSSYITDDLKKAGANIFLGHSHEYISPSMTVIYSTAISQDHPEIQAAKAHNARLMHRSELLRELMQDKQALAVTGTHGKTTTSSLLAHVLYEADLSPSFAIGGTVCNLQSNGGHGKGEFFVAEADESDGSFLRCSPYGAIITNIENDHLNYWKTDEALVAGFKQFASHVIHKEHLLWCADDPCLASLQLPGKSYGFSAEANIQIRGWRQENWGSLFDLHIKGQTVSLIEIPILGRYNALNAAAVFALTLSLGISEGLIRQAFKTFRGVKRRMEKKGENNGALIYDDYAHHPTEIRETLKAAKQATGEKRLVVAFQAHRYTRTQDTWQEYLTAFESADVLVFTDIYSSGEQPIEGITGPLLFKAIHEANSFEGYFIKRDEMAGFLSKFLRPHDVLITMGAGDITHLGPEVLKQPISSYKLAFISGGQSSEHEVSLSSTEVISTMVNPAHYETKYFTISKKGEWFIEGKQVGLMQAIQELRESDICFPLLHGPFAEDGMLQGFLETLEIPYVGCSYRTGPLVMDKVWSKRLAQTYNIPIAGFLEFFSYEWENSPQECLTQIAQTFTPPFFAKAVHLGSTIGVFRIKHLDELEKALDAICQLDYKFLVEEEIEGREIQFGFLGHEKFLMVPLEIVKLDELHTYAEKYGTTATPSIIDVSLPGPIAEEGKRLAALAYKVFECSGLSRIDFFLKPDGTWIFNEINPMPGCTPTSPYPKLWATKGLSNYEAFDLMITSGFQRGRIHNRKLRVSKEIISTSKNVPKPRGLTIAKRAILT